MDLCRFRLLGPVGIETADGFRQISGSHVRGLLAALLLDANRFVSKNSLTAALWSTPPDSADVNLRTFIMKLRRHFARLSPDLVDRIQTERSEAGAAYRITVRPEELDLTLFGERWARGREALTETRYADAFTELRSALGLWRGPSGTDLPAEGWLAHHCAGLNEQRLAAEEQLITAEIALGSSTAVVAQLRGILAEHPARERSAALLMIAYYRSGDVSVALETYQRTRVLLVERLGVDPGEEVRRIHLAVLDRDDALLLSDKVLAGLSG